MLSLTLLALAGLVAADSSDKRGLCFVPHLDHVEDNKIWVQQGSDLSWYYNYQDLPSPAFAAYSQDEFEFIPMMWGVNKDNPEDTTFLERIRDLISEGTQIKHALGFNEPDATSEVGGSDVLPQMAARAWVANFEPLGEMGVKLGLPAVTGSWDGMPWLRQFIGNCSAILSEGGKKKNCTWDFVPVHWYDNFGGMESHVNERHKEWPDKEVWITEYAYAHQELAATQEFFNQTLELFDTTDWIGRYTYFGAFRSNESNVGVNAVFLSNGGKLTDIGSWYLGFGETGVDPQSGGDTDSAASALAPMVALSGVFASLVMLMI